VHRNLVAHNRHLSVTGFLGNGFSRAWFIPWQSQLPDKPVHGKIRNYLYFDHHAATRKLGKPGSFY